MLERTIEPASDAAGALVESRALEPLSTGGRLLQEREFDIVIERLDRIGRELERIGHRLELLEALVPLTREIGDLSRSMTMLAHAAVGRQPPRVRRDR